MTDEEKFRNMASQLRKPDGEEGMKTAEWMANGNLHIIHDAMKILNAEADDNILEIGMANGFYVNEILDKSAGIQYTGCDFSPIMVDAAEKLNIDAVATGSAKVMLADIISLPFESNTFNKVFTVNTIYFWEDEPAALKEIKRVLKPNGQFIIAFRPKHQSEKYPFTKYGFNQFTKSDVTALLSANGFMVTGIYENTEPDFDLKGRIINMENVVIAAKKI